VANGQMGRFHATSNNPILNYPWGAQ